MCLWYFFKNPYGENKEYDTLVLISLKTPYEKSYEEKLIERKEYNMMV